MSKPLANLDYLLTRKESNAPAQQEQQQQRSTEPVPQQSFKPQSAFDPSAVERWIEESVVTFATPIMSHLGKTGRSSLFQLVDDLQLSVDNLRPVLDAMNIKFGWVDVDKSNLKGDWQVTLTPRGADYLKRNIR
jgi:hypothetical protein